MARCAQTPGPSASSSSTTSRRCSARSRRCSQQKGYEVVALDSPIAATQRLAQEDFDVALLDIKMPQLSGLELLTAVKHRRPEVEVIMMTGHATVETALAAVQGRRVRLPHEAVRGRGARRARGREGGRAQDALRPEPPARERSSASARAAAPEGLVGNSAPMREVVRMIEAVAYSATTVLVHGRERHRQGARRPRAPRAAARAAPSRSSR